MFRRKYKYPYYNPLAHKFDQPPPGVRQYYRTRRRSYNWLVAVKSLMLFLTGVFIGVLFYTL